MEIEERNSRDRSRSPTDTSYSVDISPKELHGVSSMFETAPEFDYPAINFKEEERQTQANVNRWDEITGTILSPFAPKYPLFDFTKYIPDKIKSRFTLRRASFRKSEKANIHSLSPGKSHFSSANNAFRQLKGFSHLTVQTTLNPKKEVKFKFGLLDNPFKDPVDSPLKSPSKIKTMLDQKNDNSHYHNISPQKTKEEYYRDQRTDMQHKILVFPVQEQNITERRYSVQDELLFKKNKRRQHPDYKDEDAKLKGQELYSQSRVSVDTSVCSFGSGESGIDKKKKGDRRGTKLGEISKENKLVMPFIRRRSSPLGYSRKVYKKVARANMLVLNSDLETLRYNREIMNQKILGLDIQLEIPSSRRQANFSKNSSTPRKGLPNNGTTPQRRASGVLESDNLLKPDRIHGHLLSPDDFVDKSFKKARTYSNKLGKDPLESDDYFNEPTLSGKQLAKQNTLGAVTDTTKFISKKNQSKIAKKLLLDFDPQISGDASEEENSAGFLHLERNPSLSKKASSPKLKKNRLAKKNSVPILNPQTKYIADSEKPLTERVKNTYLNFDINPKERTLFHPANYFNFKSNPSKIKLPSINKNLQTSKSLNFENKHDLLSARAIPSFETEPDLNTGSSSSNNYMKESISNIPHKLSIFANMKNSTPSLKNLQKIQEISSVNAEYGLPNSHIQKIKNNTTSANLKPKKSGSMPFLNDKMALISPKTRYVSQLSKIQDSKSNVKPEKPVKSLKK